MADKPLKSLTFPGLTDTYTIPEDAGDIAYSDSAAYPAGSVGAEVSDLKSAISGGGLTPAIKSALLVLATKVAYIDANGQDYYDALYDALYPPAGLVSISAVYTQSGTVYDTDTLDSLKSDLVVTANYDDDSTATIPGTDYTLSGTLVEGTSTITVSYGGETTTFNVAVSHAVTEETLTFGTCSTASNAGTKFNGTTFEDVPVTNEWLTVSTIKASTLSFAWNTTEANAFQIAIGQYDESGTPYKVSNANKYSSNPLTDGSGMTWANPKDYYYTAIGGGNIQITLPTSGVVKVVVRKSSATGTNADSNSAFASWLENGGLTITAHI